MINLPWVEKHKPSCIDDLLMDSFTKSKINENIKDGIVNMPNLLFIGSYGIGKSSLAKLIVDMFELPYMTINMSEKRNIDIFRTDIVNFATTMSLDGKMKVVIGEECDGLLDATGKSAKGIIEQVYSTTRFIFTTNHPDRVNDGIKSRSKSIYFQKVDEKSIIKKCVEIMKLEKINTPKEQIPNLIKLVRKYYPDIRQTINNLQFFCSSGTLDINFDEIQGEDIFQKFIDVIKNKKLSELRDILKNNRIDYDGVIRQVFNAIINGQPIWELDENKNAEIIILCGEFLHRSLNTISDKEVNFTAWSVELMRIVGR